MKVQPLPSNLGVDLGKAGVGHPPPMRPLALAVPGTRRRAQGRRTVPKPARVGNRARRLPRGGDRSKGLDAPIKRQGGLPTGACGRTGQDNRGVPHAMAIHEVTGFRLPHGPCIAMDPDRANARQPQAAMAQALSGHQPPAIAMHGIGPPFESLTRLETGIARHPTSLDASKEGFERPIHTLQRMLRRLGRQSYRKLRLRWRQVAALLGVADTDMLTLNGLFAPLMESVCA